MNVPPESYKRQLGPGGLECRALPADSAPVTSAEANGAPVIRGYGAVYNVVTTIGGEEYGFDEMFAPGAFAQSITEADVRCMFNHDTDNVLGRTKPGTLRLAEDATGLAYEVDVNTEDPEAVSVHAKVKRGDVDGSSVWFRCIEDNWTYPDASNGLVRPLRVIAAGALIETGPVTFPSYEDAESCARSLAPFDAVLRAVGVKSAHKRATLAADLVGNPESVADELARIFGSAESRTNEPGPTADAAPASVQAAAPASEHGDNSRQVAIARARLDLLAKSPA